MSKPIYSYFIWFGSAIQVRENAETNIESMVLSTRKPKFWLSSGNIKDYGELDTMRKIVEEKVRKNSA